MLCNSQKGLRVMLSDSKGLLLRGRAGRRKADCIETADLFRIPLHHERTAP